MNYVLSEAAHIGPCIDVKAHKGRIYAIQNSGRLCVLTPGLELIHTYEGIGNARQIEIVGDVAAVTARENGLWLFDVSEEKPVLLSHYHTVEYAVGVALCGNLAFISCRQYGVEIVDISDPEKPFFVSLVRVGEVQSAVVDGNVLYCGVWGEMKAILVDISSPANARVISEIPLWGRGDGVCVENGVLYAATGQHERGISGLTDESDPHFGNGNGVECFDVREPEHPVKINGKKFDKAYSLHLDMWEAAMYGDTLVVNDSVLGVYGLDPVTLEEKFTVKPAGRVEGDAVAGVTSLNGDLFVATGREDLFAVRGLGLAEQKPNLTDRVFPSDSTPFSYKGEGADIGVCYGGKFPVLALDGNGRLLALACAEGGVHILDKQTLTLRYTVKTEGDAMDVRVHENTLYVAEGLGGVEIFELSEEAARRKGRFSDNASINQLHISRGGRYLLATHATNKVVAYDVASPTDVKLIYDYPIRKGQLYGNNFTNSFLFDGTMILFCHRDGLIFTDPDAGDYEFHCIEYTRIHGFCSFCAGDGIETDGESILHTLDGGYVMLSIGHTDPYPMEKLTVFRDKAPFKGLFSICGDTLVATDRPTGLVFVIDISDKKAPVTKARLEVTSSPAKTYFSGKNALIPGGRDGLLCLKFH